MNLITNHSGCNYTLNCDHDSMKSEWWKHEKRDKQTNDGTGGEYIRQQILMTEETHIQFCQLLVS